MKIIKVIKVSYAFIRGMVEFRKLYTAHYLTSFNEAEAYITGRDWAHRLTFNRFRKTKDHF